MNFMNMERMDNRPKRPKYDTGEMEGAIRDRMRNGEYGQGTDGFINAVLRDVFGSDLKSLTPQQFKIVQNDVKRMTKALNNRQGKIKDIPGIIGSSELKMRRDRIHGITERGDSDFKTTED